MRFGFWKKVDQVDGKKKNNKNKLNADQLKHHWAWSQVNTLLDWRPVSFISDKILICWWMEEWRTWQIVEHPPNRYSLCKMDLTSTQTKHISNMHITTNSLLFKNLLFMDSHLFSMSVIHSSKRKKVECKMKRSQSDKTIHKDFQC